VREDIKGHQPYTTDGWYALVYVPHGYQAMINDSQSSGRVYLDYRSVLIAITASQKFQWDPAAKVFSGKGGLHALDSEFRVFGDHVAVAMETALPAEFPADSPAQRLARFKAAIEAKTAIQLTTVKSQAPATGSDPAAAPAMLARGTYVDRFGVRLDKTFQGDALVNDQVIDYATWPLVDNPWIHQEWEGNMRISDGVTERIYDISDWTITERKVAADKPKK
jgi:hypothetical protein